VSGKRIVIYGYGNPGRQDDGLGPAVIERIEQNPIPNVETDSNYQLNVEDADFIAGADYVIFVDASVSGDGPYYFEEIEPSHEITFTTHSMSPESVVALCHELYDKNTRAFILGIRGYNWEFMEDLTPRAMENLDKAYAFLLSKIEELLHNGKTGSISFAH